MTSRLEISVNPDVLKWARRMSGLTAEDAAHKAQVNPARLQDWEAGESHPTLSQVRKLAGIYKRPWAVFMLQAAPKDDPLPMDFRRFAPDQHLAVSPALRMAIRSARARRDSLLDVLKGLSLKPPTLRLSATLTEDPEKVGGRLRKAISPRPASNDAWNVFNGWRTAVEEVGLLVFQVDRIDLGEMRGFSVSERPLPIVVLNMQDAPAARSFTLLHEVAHVLLGNGGMCLLNELGPNTDTKRVEVYCNHVAGSALVPGHALLQQPEVPKRTANDLPDEILVTLARRYGVSAEVIVRRLLTLNRVTAEFYKRKRAAFERQYRKMRKEKQGGFAHPATLTVARNGRVFTRSVLEAFDEEQITASDVADLLNIRLKHLDRIRIAVHRAVESEQNAE